MPQFGVLLTDDSRGIINDHKMFTIEAIEVESIEQFWSKFTHSQSNVQKVRKFINKKYDDCGVRP